MSDRLLNIHFVREVEKHEVLYNYNHPSYTRKATVDKEWKKVATKLNLSVNDCKEKWRNIRNAYLHNMRPSAGGTKKASYYLAEYLKFCLPYIRALNNPFEKMPSVTKQEAFDSLENEEEFEENDSARYYSSDPEAQKEPSPEPPASPERKLFFPINTDVTLPSSSARAKKNQAMKNKSSAAFADQCVAEYFQAKKAKLEATSSEAARKIDRKEALKMFLLSLIPELEVLTDSQIKLFKRKMFIAIDEIASSDQLHTSYTTVISPEPSSPHGSEITINSDPLSESEEFHIYGN